MGRPISSLEWGFVLLLLLLYFYFLVLLSTGGHGFVAYTVYPAGFYPNSSGLVW